MFGELDGRPVGVFGAITYGTCRYCRSGKENLCESLTFLGEGHPGGYAERGSTSPMETCSTSRTPITRGMRPRRVPWRPRSAPPR
ncbi:MAG: hypothetical protein ACP5GG_04580 [Conexivisphaera sp.]